MLPNPQPVPATIVGELLLSLFIGIIDIFLLWAPFIANPPVQKTVDSSTDEILKMSDTQLLDVHFSSPQASSRLGEQNVTRLGSGLVGKYLPWDDCLYEARVMGFVRSQTTIPLPAVRRVVKHTEQTCGLLIMDHVPESRELRECWPSLSLWKKFKIILVLRHYLHQLHTIGNPTPQTPGPVIFPVEEGDFEEGDEADITCSGVLFVENIFLSPSSPQDLLDYYNTRLRRMKLSPYRPKYFDKMPPLKAADLTPLVFTHNDLNPRNILLDAHGQVWLIDFSFAGFYPRAFDFISARFISGMIKCPRSWQRALTLLTMSRKDFYLKQWMHTMGFGLRPVRREKLFMGRLQAIKRFLRGLFS